MGIDFYSSCMFFWTLKASDCAAWVQAWGSIGAILVGFGAASIAVRRAARQRAIQMVRKAQAFGDALRIAAHSVIDSAGREDLRAIRRVADELDELLIGARAIETELLRTEWSCATDMHRNIAARMAAAIRELRPNDIANQQFRDELAEEFKRHMDVILVFNRQLKAQPPSAAVVYG
jgi:hypothetical protein